MFGAAGEGFEGALVVGGASAWGGVGDGADDGDFASEEGEGVEAGVVDGEDAEDDDASESSDDVDGLSDGVGVSADAFGDDVDGVVAGEFGEAFASGVVFGDDFGGAESLCGLLLVWVSCEDDGVGVEGLGGELRGEADGAGADDEDGFALGEVDHAVAVYGAGEGFGHGGDFGVDAVWCGEDGFGGCVEGLGHAAVGGDADESAGGLALVVVSGGAVAAGSAAEEGFDADDVAFACVGDAGADGGDDAADFVSG